MATVFDAEDFKPEEAAASLNEAMKGWGSRPEAIIDVIAGHSNNQRQTIADTYKNIYEDDLTKKLKSELRGDFEEITTALMMSPAVYDATTLNKAIVGLGTNEGVLIEIMSSRSKDQIEAIKSIYKQEFEKNLEDDFESDTSGYFKQLLKDLASGVRSESGDVDSSAAEEDAKTIHESTEKWGRNILDIFCTRSFAHLRAMFKAYLKLSSKCIEEEIEEESRSDLRDGLVAIVKLARSSHEYFADKLYNAMKGYGTDDKALIRIVASRSEIDLACIKPVFYAKYGKSLSECFKMETGGDYMQMLLRILGTANASN